jgi:DnaJ-class molecular chaperone
MFDLKKCPQCGKSDLYDFDPIDITPIKPEIDISLFPDSNYCSKCGLQLREPCYACNGSGKTFTLSDIDLGPKFCNHCGRKTKRKKKDTKCPTCSGSGKIKKSHFCS